MTSRAVKRNFRSMSRQREHQKKRKEAGMCRHCFEEAEFPDKNPTYCERHYAIALTRNRNRMRRRTGAATSYETKQKRAVREILRRRRREAATLKEEIGVEGAG